jgi:hypothetical protein
VLVVPPAHCNVTSTCSLSSCTSTVTRSTNKRTISCRSCEVVSGACHKAGTSRAKRRTASRSGDVNARGRSRRNRAYASCSSCSWRSASSPRRSNARATRRLSGSTAAYCRAARWALSCARSRRWCQWASHGSRAARRVCSAARLNSRDAGWSTCMICSATKRSRNAPVRLRQLGTP